jgi:hypothetical protein
MFQPVRQVSNVFTLKKSDSITQQNMKFEITGRKLGIMFLVVFIGLSTAIFMNDDKISNETRKPFHQSIPFIVSMSSSGCLWLIFMISVIEFRLKTGKWFD